MKKKINLISCIVIFLAVLFANVSFADGTWQSENDDLIVIDKLMDLAVKTSVTEDDKQNVNAVNIPVVIITSDIINQVKTETGYTGNIVINDGKVYLGDNDLKQVGETSVEGSNNRTYVISLGSKATSAYNGDDMQADASDNEEGATYEAHRKYSDENFYVDNNDIIEAYNATKSSVQEYISQDSEVYALTYAGATLLQYELAQDETMGKWDASVSFKKVGDGGIFTSSKLVNNNLISTNWFKEVTVGSDGSVSDSNVSVVLPQVDIAVGESTSLKIDADTEASEGETKRFYFGGTEDGIFAVMLVDDYGNKIGNFEVFNINGNKTSVTVNGAKGTVLEAGEQYYIEVPANTNYSLRFERLESKGDLLESELSEALLNHTEPEEEEAEPELYEKVLTWFVLWIGEKLNGLIAVIAGEDISIDALVFDQYSNTALSLFVNDAKYYPDNKLITGASNSINLIFDLFTKIALVLYLIILVYLGIRITLMSTNAGKKAKYKELLLDWIKGIAILFFFPYVIRYTILLNHGLVTYIYENAGSIYGQGGGIASSSEGLGNTENISIPEDSNYMNQMYYNAKNKMSLAYSICWFVMLTQVIQFLIVYLKRVITVIFLICIFPLVAISYAIDKIGDGKSQAFNHWCKEFILQVFIQSFHAINYVLVMGIVFKLPSDNWFLQIIGITYVAKGGDILRGLFAQMQGGTGDKGGSLNVAKSLIKTKVAIDAIKSVRKVASRTFGSQSLIGKGVARVEDAYDKNLERRAIKQELKTIDTLKYASFNADGTMKKTDISDDRIKQNIDNIIFNNHATDETIVKAVNELATLDDIKLKRVINSMTNMDQNKIKSLESILGHAAALNVISNRKNNKNVDIQTSVDVVLKDRRKHARDGKTGDGRLDRYIEATEGSISKAQLRSVSAAHSITIDPEVASARPHVPEPTDPEERLKNSLAAIGNASTGQYTIAELHQHLDVVKEAKGDATLEAIVNKEARNMNYSLEDFELNLAVQTINHSNSVDVYHNPAEQRRIDESIEKLQQAKQAGKKKIILAETHAKIEDLKQGQVPTLIQPNQDTRSKIQKELEQKIAENPYLLDRGEEYETYLQNKQKELALESGKDLVAGLGMGVVGVPVSALKIGTGFASSGVMAGVSSDGKDNSINEMLTVVPSTMSLVDDVTNKVGNIVTSPVKMAGSAFSGEDQVDYSVNKKSIDINRKHFEEQAKTQAIDRELTKLEKERDALLYKLNKKAANVVNKRNP